MIAGMTNVLEGVKDTDSELGNNLPRAVVTNIEVIVVE